MQQVTYANYEAIPQRTDVRDYFKEIVLFKKAPQALTGGTFSAEQAEILRSIPKLPDNFFLFYGNGKSAARVSEDLLPAGVHKFRVEAGGPEAEISTDPSSFTMPAADSNTFGKNTKRLAHSRTNGLTRSISHKQAMSSIWKREA